MRFETLAIHGHGGPDPAYGAVMTPIYQTSTFAFKGVKQPGKFDYSRCGNPTRKALEDCLAALEGGTHGFAFATGMAAEATRAGDASSRAITCSSTMTSTAAPTGCSPSVFARHGVEVDFVNLRDLDALRKAIQAQHQGALDGDADQSADEPAGPEGHRRRSPRRKGALTICDNTFLSPYFQRPLDLGIDIVLHSTTKYINGHSDVVGGAVIVKDREAGRADRLPPERHGHLLRPAGCFLVLRGIKTLAVRMEAHNRNALAIAHWLEKHPKIERCAAPGPGEPPAARAGQAADDRLRRHLLLPREGRAGGGLRAAREREAVHAGRVPRRRGVAHRAPVDDDARLDAGGCAAGRWASPRT